jgi:hypothetical protein
VRPLYELRTIDEAVEKASPQQDPRHLLFIIY